VRKRGSLLLLKQQLQGRSQDEQAALLVKWFLPKYEHTTRVTKQQSYEIWWGLRNEGHGEIRWYAGDDLFVLMHEIGHGIKKHSRFSTTLRAIEVWQEAEAWLWAEYWCHKVGIPFDYKRADRYFRTYWRIKKRKGGRGKVRGHSMLVKWRYKEGGE